MQNVIHTVKSVQESDGTWTLIVVDEQGTDELDREEGVAEEDIEEISTLLKRNNFSVKDYLAEMTDIGYEVEYKGVHTDDNEGMKGRGWEHTRFLCTFTRGDYQFEQTYRMGMAHTSSPERDDVLESCLDDAFSVENYATGPEYLLGLDEWASDLGYTTISHAIKTWNACWELRAKVYELLTTEELENVKHASEEGRRS